MRMFRSFIRNISKDKRICIPRHIWDSVGRPDQVEMVITKDGILLKPRKLVDGKMITYGIAMDNEVVGVKRRFSQHILLEALSYYMERIGANPRTDHRGSFTAHTGKDEDGIFVDVVMEDSNAKPELSTNGACDNAKSE